MDLSLFIKVDPDKKDPAFTVLQDSWVHTVFYLREVGNKCIAPMGSDKK